MMYGARNSRLWCEAPTVKSGESDCTRQTNWKVYASRSVWLTAFPQDKDVIRTGKNYQIGAYMCGNHAHMLEKSMKSQGFQLERVDLDGPDGLLRR